MKNKSTKTILTLTLALAVVYYFTSWQWAFAACFCFGFIGLFSDFLSQKIHWAWMRLAHIMGFVSSNVLLSLFFYLIVFPVSALSKLFRKKDLLKLKNNSESTFTNYDKTFTKVFFEKPW
ncbi:MAG: hypothetical protein A2275_16840 [Bacteroidetes bacterium RIFOXYA12_FULL_35_11]|nr:MAG: hypothetical protein A2X01_12620 [Bacteroidetes bacterium GWF2_35_48]OFY82218.1 MAG: hypothetical protein A2275_16840 [Bacteroidetes bacterium RIFOXYA12_FULL_35_11]OFY93250.1 MAG: hypothetical protein A2491_16535 [Bacteroidetes bacterium RIFOXYC12_FULL_35_7]OFY94156.1 MAG: hypothetical protein A2309_04200 [Bacteroidetes bacterium RIFOXYB2_FULL_35_7]HBX49706.1 hypothetical protein [Bacteroidales bacterium]